MPYTIVLLIVCFLFYGGPDVWDRMHEMAMGQGCAKVEKNGKSKLES